jgi:LemA protein
MGILVLVILLVAAVVTIGYFVGIYNQLIQVKVNVDKAWSNIEVLEKQRYDEIPKLVKVCEGYMQYERETLEKVIEARTRFLQAKGPADMAEAGSQMAGALKTLFAVAERYPDLKANQNFTQLQGRVTALENEIADRREFYNDSVTINNSRIQQIPYVLFAGMLNCRERELYKVAEAERVSPEIKFQFPKTA